MYGSHWLYMMRMLANLKVVHISIRYLMCMSLRKQWSPYVLFGGVLLLVGIGLGMINPVAAQGSDGLRPIPSPAPGSSSADWSNRFQFSHAEGRAFLSTVVPMTAGTLTMAIDGAVRDDPRLRGPVTLAGACLAALGVAVGPSMGMWCVDEDLATPAWGSLGVRTAGIGAIGFGIWQAGRDRDDAGIVGVALYPLALAIYTLPGIALTTAGVYWARSETPDRLCESAEQRAQIQLQPHTDATGGHGLALRVQW